MHRRAADAPELGAPALVLGEDLLVHVGGEPDVVVDQEHRVAGRPLDADVALDREPARRRVHVVERDARVRAKLLDLGTAARLALESTTQSSAGRTVCSTMLRTASTRRSCRFRVAMMKHDPALRLSVTSVTTA